MLKVLPPVPGDDDTQPQACQLVSVQVVPVAGVDPAPGVDPAAAFFILLLLVMILLLVLILFSMLLSLL